MQLTCKFDEDEIINHSFWDLSASHINNSFWSRVLREDFRMKDESYKNSSRNLSVHTRNEYLLIRDSIIQSRCFQWHFHLRSSRLLSFKSWLCNSKAFAWRESFLANQIWQIMSDSTFERSCEKELLSTCCCQFWLSRWKLSWCLQKWNSWKKNNDHSSHTFWKHRRSVEKEILYQNIQYILTYWTSSNLWWELELDLWRFFFAKFWMKLSRECLSQDKIRILEKNKTQQQTYFDFFLSFFLTMRSQKKRCWSMWN